MSWQFAVALGLMGVGTCGFIGAILAYQRQKNVDDKGQRIAARERLGKQLVWSTAVFFFGFFALWMVPATQYAHFH